MQALILAAGVGSRFGEYTTSIPKGLIRVGGQPMITRSIETLAECGIEEITIATGYKHECFEELKDKYSYVKTCYSPLYAKTNSMYTLYNSRDIIRGEDFLLLESDIIYQRKAVDELLSCPHPDVMLISSITKFQDQYYVEHNTDKILTNCSTDPDCLDFQGELVGIHKISAPFYEKMCESYRDMIDTHPKLGYEYQLLNMSKTISPVYVHKVEDLVWYEIDDENDLKYAEENVVPFL